MFTLSTVILQAVLVASGGLSYARSCTDLIALGKEGLWCPDSGGATDLSHRIADSFNLKAVGRSMTYSQIVTIHGTFCLGSCKLVAETDTQAVHC